MHPSPVLLDFRLTVLYHGLKATQYFSKFTEGSISVLKEDLLTLGLPHPRKENITLLSHGLVECFWPSARKNHVLHQNLIAKTQQTPTFEELTRKLSISSVRLKERPAAEPSNVDLDKPKNLKRPYSRFEKQGSISASSDDSSNARVKARGTAAFDARSSRSPAFHARSTYMDSGLRTNDSVAGPSRSIPIRRNDDDFSRPGKVPKIHSQGFQISQRRDTPRYPSDRSRLFDNRFKEPSTPASRPTPASAHTKLDHTFKATSEKTSDANPGAPSQQKPLVGEKVKVEEQAVDEFLNNLNLHPSAPIEGGTSSGSSSSASNLRTTEAQINILLDFHNLRRLSADTSSPLVTTQHKDPSIANNSDDFGDIPGLNVTKLRMQTATSVGTLPTPPPSAPFFVPPIEGRSRSAALPPSPLAKLLQNKEGADSVSYAPTAMNRSTSIGIGGESKAPRSEDDLEQELLGRYGRSYKELCYVKEEIAKLMKREEEINEERRRIRNLLTPKIGRFDDEEGIGDQYPEINGNVKNAELEAMRTRLDEMHKECASERLARTTESQKIEEERKLWQEETRLLNEERKLRLEERKILDEERRRRDEAENALADVRRECRQPFVVPSLLDTFVELSKLTTRGLKVSAAPLAAASTSSFSESWGSQDRGAHNFSRPITNNRYRDIPTVDDKDKTREQARIKAETMIF